MSNTGLSLEQEFTLADVAMKVKTMEVGQIRAAMVELYRQMLLRDNSYRIALQEKWGIDTSPPPRSGESEAG